MSRTEEIDAGTQMRSGVRQVQNACGAWQCRDLFAPPLRIQSRRRDECVVENKWSHHREKSHEMGREASATPFPMVSITLAKR